jgi:hypothetical protein
VSKARLVITAVIVEGRSQSEVAREYWYLPDPDASFDAPNQDKEARRSMPVPTTELDGLTATVIRVDYGGKVGYPLYCVSETTWTLTGIFGLFTDALLELRQWRAYLAEGGSLASWVATHPDGIRPNTTSAVAR